MTGRLIILEGPDGAGKSTLAKELQKLIGGQILHFDRQKHVTSTDLSRIYTEAMLPAVLGYDNLIIDRCWLSEKPYADVFWNGDDRLQLSGRRLLERIAMRARACVIRMDPGWDVVKENFLARKNADPSSELLEGVEQLERIYLAYKNMETALPQINYDYRIGDPKHLLRLVEELSTDYHPTWHTAGNMNADILIVTPPHPTPAGSDSYYRWPMTEQSGVGESRWVARQLAAMDIGEEELKWVTSDKLQVALRLGTDYKKVIALGHIAASACRELKLEPIELAHPTTFRKANKKSDTYFLGVL